MQDIADAAGINKAMLHYYFRNKEKLFQTIFAEAFENFFPRLSSIVDSDRECISRKLKCFALHISIRFKHVPYLPHFYFKRGK